MGRCQTCDRFDRRCPANILGVNQFLKTADIKSIPESTKKELVYILWLKYFLYLFTHIYDVDPRLTLVISNYKTWPVLKHCRPGNGFSSKSAEEVDKENPISFNRMIGRASSSKLIFPISRSTSFNWGPRWLCRLGSFIPSLKDCLILDRCTI